MKLGNIAKLTLATALATSTAFAATAGSHASTKLRIQTHYAPETVSGKLTSKHFIPAAVAAFFFIRTYVALSFLVPTRIMARPGTTPLPAFNSSTPATSICARIGEH